VCRHAACRRVVGRSRGAGRAPFDRLELRVTFAFVLRRLPKSHLDDSHLNHFASNFVGRLELVPVRLSSSVCEYA
jgi:hypothetical protein